MSPSERSIARSRRPGDGSVLAPLRLAIVGLVGAYLSLVLVAPLAALLVEAADVGLPQLWSAVFAPEALDALAMSLVLVSIAVVVNAVVGTVGAIVVTRHRFFGRALASSAFDLPLAISPVMIGLAFLLLLGRGGWLEPALQAIGLKVLFAFPGLLIATLFVTLPYTMREVALVLDELGTSEEEAAITLGASPWQTFWRVTLPSIRAALGYGLLMTAARALGEFGAVLVLGGSISGQTRTATTYIHDAVEERNRAGAYGMAILLGIVSVLLLFGLEAAKRGARRAEDGSRS